MSITLTSSGYSRQHLLDPRLQFLPGAEMICVSGCNVFHPARDSLARAELDHKRPVGW